jgi:hypothetical protein
LVAGAAPIATDIKHKTPSVNAKRKVLISLPSWVEDPTRQLLGWKSDQDS